VGINRRYEVQRDSRHIPTVPWHPMMDATELQPGLWALSTGSVAPIYARVQLVRRGDELGYRAEHRDGTLIGYYVNFRSACLNAWQETIGPPGGLREFNRAK